MAKERAEAYPVEAPRPLTPQVERRHPPQKAPERKRKNLPKGILAVLFAVAAGWGSPAASTLNEHLARNSIVLLVLTLVDKLFLSPWLAGCVAGETSAPRWFFLHFLANAVVCATAWNSCRAVLADPLHALDGRVYTDTSLFGNASVWPLTIINSVHVYHMVGGFKLSGADYFHHLLFIPTIAFPGQIFRWGALGNFQAFFISGFPGGVTYLLLGLGKIGRVQSMVEKRATANLNTWVRAPGIIMAVTLLYQALLLEMHVVPLWAVYIQLTLPLYNALYFNKQAVANYAVHYMLHLLGQDELVKKHIEQRISCTTGEMVMSWKDAVAVPQRGS